MNLTGFRFTHELDRRLFVSSGKWLGYFDFDGDWFEERTGWVRPDDCFLVIDIDGNGLIESVVEIFSNTGTRVFAALAARRSDSAHIWP